MVCDSDELSDDDEDTTHKVGWTGWRVCVDVECFVELRRISVVCDFCILRTF